MRSDGRAPTFPQIAFELDMDMKKEVYIIDMNDRLRNSKRRKKTEHLKCIDHYF